MHHFLSAPVKCNQQVSNVTGKRNQPWESVLFNKNNISCACWSGNNKLRGGVLYPANSYSYTVVNSNVGQQPSLDTLSIEYAVLNMASYAICFDRRVFASIGIQLCAGK